MIIETDFKWAWALTPRQQTTKLIIHHAAANTATVEQIHAGHLARNMSGIAYHYYVRKDGTIYRGRPENMQGGHTSGYNYTSIGVCFEGNFEEDYMSDAQLEAGRWLIADILTRYPNLEIGKHSQYNATACPGAHFPFDIMVNPNDEGDAEEVQEWAIQGRQWCMEHDITDGTRPNDAVTRAEIWTMIWRARHE